MEIFKPFAIISYNRDMYSYEIWIRSQQYHGKSPLTYTSVRKLTPGTIVKVDLRKKPSIGIIRREAPAPKGIAMKPIDDVLFDGNYRLPPESLKLLSWLLLYYPAGSGVIAQLFLPGSWPKMPETTERAHFTSAKLPKLHAQQSRALKKIRSHRGSFLLHGETGSGKTRIYSELAQDALKNGRSSLILVPEIGLVSHLESQLQTVFDPSIVKVFHSGLTPAQRRTVWTEILTATQPLVVIGPRSALFAPLNNIGLIVVDECHDDGYKQENSPHYHGLRVASQLARFHEATLIFGSATPSITDVHIAHEKDIPIIRMTEIANQDKTTEVQKLVISRQDQSEFTRSSLLSTSLINEIRRQLQAGQQSLLFLNRRGSAKVIACNQCSWRAMCPTCDLPLTFHEDTFVMRCHTCGYNTKAPTRCPDCGNTDIVFYGPGTKTIQKEVTKLFPEARVARFDSDNLTHERLGKNLNLIQSGEIDIIIGTQILVKGFDIPKLGLVGIVDADASLTFPDFATEEKTYQLISQAAGRVGRGHLPGVVIMQSLQPKSPLIKQAMARDWNNFYKNQLEIRKKHVFPPYTFLLKLECSRKRRDSASTAAQKLKAILASHHQDVTILGPTPAFKEKIGSQYTWQLVIKSPRRSTLLNIIDNLPSGWHYDIDPTHLL